jgi:hypothetical protein
MMNPCRTIDESASCHTLWRIALRPAHDGCMRKMQSTFGHHLDQIAKAELVAQVPTHAEDDHFAVEVPPNQILEAVPFALRDPQLSKDHCIRRAGTICTRADLARDAGISCSTANQCLSMLGDSGQAPKAKGSRGSVPLDPYALLTVKLTQLSGLIDAGL